MPAFGDAVDNSKLTPEFHMNEGQVNDTADNNKENEPNISNTPQDGQVLDNEGNQDGIVVGDETFNSQEDLINAYNNMKQELETRTNSYKELQSAYTKSRQEIALRNKRAVPNNPNRNVTIPPMPPVQPIQNPYGGQQFNPYYNPYMGMNNQVPRVNPIMPQQYPDYQEQQNSVDKVNQAMIDMAIDNKIMELKASDKEFDEVASELWNVINEDEIFKDMSFVNADQARNAIDTAYRMAKQNIAVAKANIKVSNAKAEAYQSKQEKILNNDVSNVAKQNNKQQEKTAEQKVKDSILGAKPQIF